MVKNGDRDGIPNVIPEAMSSGCLVVASKFAGASEAFIEDVSGFSICPFETESWVDLIEQFWNSPESFESIRKSGVKHSKEVFDVKKTANSIVSLIKRNWDVSKNQTLVSIIISVYDQLTIQKMHSSDRTNSPWKSILRSNYY